jgi:hypothetical protein
MPSEGLGEANETQHRQGPQLRRRNRRVETRRKLALETEHRQVKYLNNVLEADHGKLKLLIKPVRGFKSMPTAYATIKGFEVMRALRKGQARAWCLQPGIRGEVRLIERAFGIGPSVMTEAMDVLNQHFANAA